MLIDNLNFLFRLIIDWKWLEILLMWLERVEIGKWRKLDRNANKNREFFIFQKNSAYHLFYLSTLAPLLHRGSWIASLSFIHSVYSKYPCHIFLSSISIYLMPLLSLLLHLCIILTSLAHQESSILLSFFHALQKISKTSDEES